MAKGKMPPQLVEYYKNKNAKKEDGTKMSDKDKRKAALEKAKQYKEQKKNKESWNSKTSCRNWWCRSSCLKIVY